MNDRRGFFTGRSGGEWLRAVAKTTLVVCAFVFAFSALPVGGAQAATINVEIHADAFKSPLIFVKVGDTVTWTNADSVPHSVADGFSVFDSGPIAPGGSFSHTFTEDEQITHEYWNGLGRYFTGRVVVRPAENTPAFIDVPPASPYSVAVESLASSGAINGYLRPDGFFEFRPDNPVLRAQFTKILVGVAEIPVVPNAPIPFTDVERDPFGYPWDFVAAAFHGQVTQGRTPTLFAPYMDVLRAQASTLEVRALQQLYPWVLQDPPPGYQNAWGTSFSDIHGPLARIAEYNGLFAGVPLGTTSANPFGSASRGELAQMMYNMRNLVRDVAPPVGQNIFSGEGEFSGVLTVDVTTGNPYHDNFGRLAGPTNIEATLDASEVEISFLVGGATVADNELEYGIGNLINFSATGTGTYAGYPGIDFQFEGYISDTMLSGNLTVGLGGGLPGGEPIVYLFEGDRIDPPPFTVPPFLQEFMAEWVAAKQSNDVGWLFDHLHPAVIDLYGQERCWLAIDAEDPDPSYAVDIISAIGPAEWIYDPDAGTSTVPDVYTLRAGVTWSDGTPVEQDLHFGWSDGELYWFANLGPL